MKKHEVLTPRKAREVIRIAGYKVVSFEEGAPHQVTAYLFRVGRFERDGRASLENGLREDLKDADKVAVDSLGRGTVVVSGEPAAAREAVLASLQKRGIATEGLETKGWPKPDATYVVAMSGMNGAVEAQTAADTLARVAKVLAVHVYQDTGTATLWLKEPCDALEANVKAALAPAGLSVSRFELVKSDAPATASR
jgi:hypothetical protein